MLRLFNNANYDFIGRRKLAYMFSAALIAIGVIGVVMNFSAVGSWVKYGVDFTGGSLVQVEIQGADDIAEVRGIVDAAVPGSDLNQIGGGNTFQIRTPRATEDVATGPAEQAIGALQQRYGQESVRVMQNESVGAKVADELQTRALIAILLSLAATLIYLAFRFEWRFGVAAVIATAHDILLTLSFIALLRLEVSLVTVAALLTIVGYSLNDTIVIFDRIRENLRSAKRHNFSELVNRSINETLPRTVVTGFTTIAALISLFIFAGGDIREFALIMILGIVLGTYSSIFIASPVLLAVEQRFPQQEVTKKRPTRSPSSRTSNIGA